MHALRIRFDSETLYEHNEPTPAPHMPGIQGPAGVLPSVEADEQLMPHAQ